MKKKTRFLTICFVLCALVAAFAIVPGSFAEDAPQGLEIRCGESAVNSVTLPQNEKLTLTAVSAGAAGDYQWQIQVSGDVWANIFGATDSSLDLSYAMVANLLNNGSANIRCQLTAANADPLYSNAVKVTVKYAEPQNVAAATGYAAVAQSDSGETAAQSDPDLTRYNIVINYVYGDGIQAAPSWTATVGAGESFVQTVPSPSVVGYTPDQENVAFDLENIQADQIIRVTYSPANVNFTVKHYQQNISDDNYTLAETETKTGVTESAVGSNLAKTYDGFYSLLYDGTIKIAADGSTVVEIYYDRYYYLMSFNLDGGYGVEPIYARYGADISVGTPIKAGYTFAGWDAGSIPATMPAESKTYTAQWTPGESGFTVVFWYENADDENYSVAGTFKPGNVAPGTEQSSADYQNQNFAGRDAQHFTYNPAKAETVTVAGDGSTVLNVYFTRKTYTLTFQENKSQWGTNWQTVATITAKYDAEISGEFNKAPFNTTYNGRAWEDDTGKTYSYALQTLDRMPGNNVTFHLYNQSSNTKKTIYYYVQKVGTAVSNTQWPTNTNNFDLLKQVDTYFNFATYNEEYHEIQGFTRYERRTAGFDTDNQKKFTNNKLNLYYLRNSYQLQFYNYTGIVDSRTASVQYEAPLSGYDFEPPYPSTLEEGAYIFDGWYTNQFYSADGKVDFDTAIMPANNVILYAHWVPVNHTVKTYLTKDALDNGEATLNTWEAVPHGTAIGTAPTEPERGEYTFVGWFYEGDNGEERAFDFSMPVKRDLNLYAKWSSNVLMPYTVHYQLEDGTPVAEDSHGSALAGTTKTFDAKFGDLLNEGYQTGFFPQTASHSLTIDITDASKNEFTFIYVEKAKVPYTVKYLEYGTNAQLHLPKSVETGNAVITEQFVPITGYMPDAYQKRLILSADGENELIFWYVADVQHAPVLITHWIQNTEGEGYSIRQETTDLNGVIGNDYSETPLNLPGYTYNETKSNNSGKLTGEGLSLNLYYDLIEYPYIFKYVDKDTGEEIAEAVSGTARYLSQVVGYAKDIPGYTLISAEQQAMQIAIEEPADTASENVKTFYYTEDKVQINYEVVGPTGCGTVSLDNETVNVKTGTVQGSVAAENEGFRFVGWYLDDVCTQPADTLVSDKKLTPVKNDDGLYESATYYAKFVYDVADLTIFKTGWEEIDENQSFVFRVSGTANDGTEIDMKVVIQGNGSTTIKKLPIGTYTVTEDTNWSWRYDLENKSQEITLSATTPNELTFANNRADASNNPESNDWKWLNGSAWCDNLWGDATPEKSPRDN